MNIINNDQKKTMKIIINSKTVTLKFAQEPNHQAADFIKKTLINAFLVKVV